MIGLKYIAFVTETQLKEIASNVNVSPQAVGDWMKGKKPIANKHIPVLSRLFGVSEEYISKELTLQDKVDIELQLNVKVGRKEGFEENQVTLLNQNGVLKDQYYELLDILEHQAKTFKGVREKAEVFQRGLNNFTMMDSVLDDLDTSEKLYDLLKTFQSIRKDLKEISE